MPLTTVTVEAGPREGVGTRFLARTALGPLGFDDPMEVTEWQPPTDTAAGKCRVEKRGRTMLGWTELTVSPTPHGSEVRWVEEARVARIGRVGRLLDQPNDLIGRVVFGRLVERLLGGPDDIQRWP